MLDTKGSLTPRAIYMYIYMFYVGNRAPPFPPGYSNFFTNTNNKKFEKHGFICAKSYMESR